MLESINDDTPPPSSAERRAAAFQAAPFHWHDLQLAPLSIGREGDWLMHCARIGLPPLHEVINRGEAFLPHALRLLWFCAHEPARWLAVWMKGGPAAPILLETEIRAWLDDHVKSTEGLPVLKLALAIWDRAHETRAVPTAGDDDDTDDDPGNASGPDSARSTSASSAAPVRATPPTTSSTTSRRRRAGPSSTPTASPKGKSTKTPKPSRPRKKPPARG